MVFSIPTNHEDLKRKRIRFVKDWYTSLTLFVVYISHFEERFLKNDKKIKRACFINSLKPVLSIYQNSIKSLVIPKISLTRGSPRKQVFQDDEYTDFAANDTISTMNYITK